MLKKCSDQSVPFKLVVAAIFFAGITTIGHTQSSFNIDNPVLPGVADAGVIKFNGEYYIGGVHTDGGFYRSKDLVHWEGPFHVFSMDNSWTQGASARDNRIHANDINYINGVFNLYWSVNHWGENQHVVHIGHAMASDILGPYTEPVKNTWLTNRIDPHLFEDDDGSLYLYMVKFTDGNTIWGQRMKDPGTLKGRPVYLFASLPNTWETRDNRVAEGPWVIHYRNQYYMIYNTNHTSTKWGNYAFGVAQADAPLGFNHGNKYSYPVLQSNQIALEARFVDLLKYSPKNPGLFSYTFEQPPENWNTTAFDVSGWRKGRAGFGADKVKNSTTQDVQTEWETPKIWLRKTFALDKEKPGNLMLRIHHTGATNIFLNGVSIYKDNESQFATWNFDARATTLLQKGKNVLAIESTKGERSAFLDVSIFELKDQRGDDILYNPGQPNIVRGPNGFEWWLVYFAVKNGLPKGQFIDRVHFFGDRLYVDGITGSNTPGYHPEPAAPTFQSLFNEAGFQEVQSKWNLQRGQWKVDEGEWIQTAARGGEALIKRKAVFHYLFQAGIKLNGSEAAPAGVYAWWQDEDNWLKVMLNPKRQVWSYIINKKGERSEFSFPLPSAFNYKAYHSLKIYKNGPAFTVEIDHKPAPVHPVIQIPAFSDKGIPGLVASEKNVAFDGITYTIGWDEYGQSITGWKAKKGKWAVSEKGIQPTSAEGISTAFKGDLLERYEVSLQITSKAREGNAGIYPVYVDEDNYIKAVFDFKDQQLEITTQQDGNPVQNQTIALERNRSLYTDMAYSDFIKKQFTFQTPTYIDAIKLSKTPPDRPDTLLQNMYEQVNLFYKKKGQWRPLNQYKEVSSEHPGYEKIAFEPIQVEALKFVNKGAQDFHRYLYQIWVHERFKQSYHLRVAKRESTIIFLVDGRKVLQMENTFPASQVGLFAKAADVTFNGITLFHLPQNKPISP